MPNLRNDRLKLEVTEHDQQLTAQLTLPTGYQSPEVPVVVLEIANRMEERVLRVCEYRVLLVEGDEQELHLAVRSVFHGITVGLWLRATDDGELSVIVPPAEVEEQRGELFQLNALQVLPGLLTAGADGTLLLPVNTGVLCSPAGKPAVRDRFLIYGEQERWELVPTVPVAGLQTPGGGLVALATQGAHDMYCDVATDGAGHGSVSLCPMFRRAWIDPVDWGEREVRLAPLEPGADLTVRAAKRLRRHVLDDLGKPTLTQRAEESPQCAYQQQAFTMKLFHGMQQQGIMMFGREERVDPKAMFYKSTLPFAEARAGMRRLKDAGLDRIYFQSVGWNPKGHDGAWPTQEPIDRRAGGEAGFRAMIGEAKDLGYHITTHLNLASAMFRSPDFHADWCIHDIWGEPRVIGFWGGGVKSTHWGLAVPEDVLRGRLESMKRFGFNGMQYLDGIGNPLYVNYHPTHRGGRRDHAAGINRYLDLAREVFGAVQTEMGFLYCALHADAMVNPGSEWHLKLCREDWPVTALLDRRVPVWHLALHDLLTCEAHGVTWQDNLRCALFAGVPRDEWCSRPGFYPVLDDERIGQLKQRYDLCLDRLGHLIPQELTDWRQLADGVEQTTFADGTTIVADFNEGRLLHNEQEVPNPEQA